MLPPKQLLAFLWTLLFLGQCVCWIQTSPAALEASKSPAFAMSHSAWISGHYQAGSCFFGGPLAVPGTRCFATYHACRLSKLQYQRFGSRLGAFRPSTAQMYSASQLSDVEGAPEFILKLDEDCHVRVLRQLLPESEAKRALQQVPADVAPKLRDIGSRKSNVYFDEPKRDYIFSGRKWSMCDNEDMPASIKHVQEQVKVATSVPFNGAVVNVYDTPIAQIKWHDDGEYGVGPTVASYSLGRAAVMGFRRKRGKRRTGQWGQRIPSHAERPGTRKPALPEVASLLPGALDSSTQASNCELPVFEAVADSSGVVRLEVRHNTLVIMEAGVQDEWEHRVFRPLPTAAGRRAGVDSEDLTTKPEPEVDPRINLTFHVHC